MDDKLTKILKIIAVTGIVTAGVISVAKSGMLKEMLQKMKQKMKQDNDCLLYTSPSPRDAQ